jgi:hypothetical protein
MKNKPVDVESKVLRDVQIIGMDRAFTSLAVEDLSVASLASVGDSKSLRRS